MSVEIIQANVQAVQNLSNQVLISTANESINGLCQYIPKQSGQVIGSSDDLLIKNGRGQTFQWDITVPEGSIINTANSYIHHKIKFTFNCKCSATPADNSGAGALQPPSTNPNDTSKTLYLPPGRYTVLDTGLWCEPAYVKADGSIVSYDKPKWICQFPMNSSNILESSKVSYGNVSHTDEEIFRQRPIIQAHLSEEYQAMYCTQFFDQNIDPIMRFLVPGKPVAEKDNVFNVVVNKTFTIGLNMINQLFDIKNKFYTAAYTKQVVQLRVKLQPYSIAQLFFTEDYCDKAKTGISEMELYCYTKSSSTIPSELNDKGAFVQMYHKYTTEALTLSGGLSNKSEPVLSSGHNSTNDVCLCINIPDITSKDSTFLKQRYTPFNATQIGKIYNKEWVENQFVFFSDFNINRGSSANRYFTEDLKNPMLMRHETLRSMSALQQYDTSVSPSFNTILKQMTKYAMIRVNLEAYSMESLADTDVKYDGYHSVLQHLQVKTGFKVYNLDKDTIENYSTLGANDQGYIDGGIINLTAFQFYDQAVILNPKTGSMNITEDIFQK